MSATPTHLTQRPPLTLGVDMHNLRTQRLVQQVRIQQPQLHTPGVLVQQLHTPGVLVQQLHTPGVLVQLPRLQHLYMVVVVVMCP